MGCFSILPLQGSTWQMLVCTGSPVQSRPSPSDSGRLQLRVLYRAPLSHFVEHGLHFCHSHHPPSTLYISNDKKKKKGNER